MNTSTRMGFVVALSLGACGSPEPQRDQAPAPIVMPTQSAAIAPTATPTTSSYKPRFEDREGDTYFYATAPTDEDQKKGNVLGSVVSFRYLGKRDGKHTIVSVDNGGRTALRYECSEPCKIIKRTFRNEIDRVPYDTRSVLGAAFEDALNGSLRVASKASASEEQQPATSTTIPSAFVGEWNDDLNACGTDNNDSRLRIEPKRVRFYESDGDVRRVEVINSRAIKVTASFAGEGQTWADSTDFVLSRSGEDLTSGGLTRHRCPT